MDDDNKLFWKIVLFIVASLFAISFFLLVIQISRHSSNIIPVQTLHTNIGISLLCIGFGFIFYYVLNREEFSEFFEKRIAAQKAFISDPEKFREYQRLRYTLARGLPADQFPSRQELARKGNLYLKIWVLYGIVVIVLAYFLLTRYISWVTENRSWVLVVCLIVFSLFFLIDQLYHQNAAGYKGWGVTSANEILYRQEMSPLILVTLIIIISLLILEWAMFQWIIPPYSQNNFLIIDLKNPSLYFQFTPLVCFIALVIVYYIFRLKE